MSNQTPGSAESMVVVTAGFGSHRFNPLVRRVYQPYRDVAEKTVLLTPEFFGALPFDKLYAAIEREIAERRERHNTARMTLVGHSLGGLLMTKYALEHPDHVKGIVTIGSPFEKVKGNIVPFDFNGKVRARIRDRLGSDINPDIDVHCVGSDFDWLVPTDSALPEHAPNKHRVSNDDVGLLDNVRHLRPQLARSSHIPLPMHTDVVDLVEEVAQAS